MSLVQPTITVLMPMYNSEEFIREAIDSIITQTFTDFEFLIIDDSSDKSYEIVKSYSDPRIRIIKNSPPLGLRKSSNLGIREAKGKYIARMESDDIAFPNRLEKQFKFMESHPKVTVSGCYIETFGNETGVWKFPLTDAEIKAGLIWGITIGHPTSFFRREFLLSEKLFYNEDGFSYAEDWEFFYTMRNKAVFQNIGEVLYRYRRSGGSVTKRMKPNRDKIMNEMFSRVLSEFGILFSDEDIKLHRMFVGDFYLDQDFSNLKKAQQWLNRLIEHNATTQTYSQDAFKRICEDKWKSLFYLIAPLGSKAVYLYFSLSSKIYYDHIAYYVKHSINKLIGRNPIG